MFLLVCLFTWFLIVVRLRAFCDLFFVWLGLILLILVFGIRGLSLFGVGIRRGFRRFGLFMRLCLLVYCDFWCFGYAAYWCRLLGLVCCLLVVVLFVVLGICCEFVFDWVLMRLIVLLWVVLWDLRCLVGCVKVVCLNICLSG